MLLLGKQQPSMLLVLVFAFVFLQQPHGGSVTAKKMKDIFSKMGIFCNPNPKYGVATNVIATVEALPKKIKFLTRIYSTSDSNVTSYMILRFMTPHQEGVHWSKSSNLRREFNRLHIDKPSNNKLPYNIGYYVSASPIFYQYTHVDLQIEVVRIKGHGHEAAGRKIALTIKPPLDCMPDLNMFECENALSPMNIQVGEYIHLNAIFDNNCSTNAVKDLRYKWNVYDMLGENLFATLGETTVPQFDIAAFQLSFTFADNAIRHRLMVEVTTLFKGTKIILRCYINLKHGQVKAEITGGPRRYVNVKKKILMDGSKSLDATGGHNSDTLYFNWGCTSKHGSKHLYCKANMSNEISFSIPNNKLKVQREYIYTLTVTSKEDKEQTSVAKQTIIVVDRDVISLEIVCVSNCRLNYFSKGKDVVLKGVCNDCGKQTIHYEWFLDDMVVGQKQTLRTKIEVEKHKVHVKLAIETHDGRYGTGHLILYENNGPVGGRCDIEPNNGWEIKTNFHIKCHGWVTDKLPLRYYIIAKKVTLTACKSSHCEVQLPTTKLVVVRVCDSVMVCQEVQLPVDVRPWMEIPKKPEDIKKMLQSPILNVNEMFKTGHEDKAHLILNAIATQITTSKQAEPIMEVLLDHLPNNVFELGKMGNLTRSLFDSFGGLNNEETRIIVLMSKLLNDNFQQVIDKGLSHHLGYEPFKNVTVSLMSVLRNLHNMTATLPKPPEYFLKMLKDKPYTEEFVNKLRKEIERMPIKEARERTSIWLESNYQLDRLNKFLNDANAWHVGADEDLRPAFYEGISIQHICLSVDENAAKVLPTADHIHVVHFTTNLLEELSDYLGSKRLCLKVVSIKRDLGWWYPQERQPSKIILSVSVYTKAGVMPRLHELYNSLLYFVYLGKYKPAQRRTLLGSLGKSSNGTMGAPWDDHNGTFINANKNAVAFDGNGDDDDYDDTALWLTEPFINLVDLSRTTSYNPDSNNDDDDDDDDNDDNDFQYTYNEEEDTEEDENEEDDYMTINDMDNTDTDTYTYNGNRRGHRRKRVVEEDKDRASSYGSFDNALMQDSIDLYEEIQHYHVPVDGRSILAVRFVNSSHDLRVHVSLHFAPKRRETSNSKCHVLAGDQNRTILLANTCKEKAFGFIAIGILNQNKTITCGQNNKKVDNGPAKYSFVLQIRACDYWHSEYNDDDIDIDDESEWRMYGCMPTMTYNIARGMSCACQYISTYTAYVFNLPARKIRSPPCISVLPIRAEVVIFFIIIYAILFGLLFSSLYWIKEEITTYCDILVNEENTDEDMHLIIVVIRTGGHKYATTTANVTITFQTYNYEELGFTLYQNPTSPVLISNTAYIIKFESRDIRLPTRLGVSHDNAGRYPSWNVAYIEVLDKTTHQYQHFDVRDWIREGQVAVLSTPVMHNQEEPPKEDWTQLFRSSIERNFVNWWGFQPLFGVWRPTFNTRPMTRFERMCIWIAKFVVAMTISFLYYGRTTAENFEDEFVLFHYSVVYVPFGETVWICCICYFAINVVQYAYEFVLLPLQDRLTRRR